jgi:hypothetical protein
MKEREVRGRKNDTTGIATKSPRHEENTKELP